MNSIITAKVLNSPTSYAGQKFEYAFRELPQAFEEKAVQKQLGKLSNRFAALTKAWTIERNSEWICRHYLAMKMIFGATLQLNNLRYGLDKNIKLTTSYLAYYSLLSLMRAVLFTSPEIDWNDGEIILATHSKIRKSACSRIQSYNKEKAEELKGYALKLKAWRELISYRSPTKGDPFKLDLDEHLTICTVLVEIAQLQSELLERLVLKNSQPNTKGITEGYFEKIFSFEKDGEYFFDDEDWYRLGYIARKFPIPVNLLHMMTEGHVEDFFGAWIDESEEDNDKFNPDEDWHVIFDIP